jgi:TRAP-type C4-dicarboxylate transport system permease small subunit
MENRLTPEPSVFRFGRNTLAVLGRIELAATVLSIMVICGLTGASIILRYFFGASLLWGEEVSLLLMKVMVFAGAAAVYKGRAYIAIDFVFRAFGSRGRYALSIVAWIAAAGFAGVIVYEGVLLYPTQIHTRTYLLELPKFYFTLPVIYGAASIVLTSAYYAALLAFRLRAGDDFTETDDALTVLPNLVDRQ